jgi:hypothetical protein
MVPDIKGGKQTRVSESKVLRRTFGPRRNEVRGCWRGLYNEELHNLHSSPSIIRMIKSKGTRRAGYVARMREKRNVYRLLVETPEGMRLLRRPRRRPARDCTANYRPVLSAERAPCMTGEESNCHSKKFEIWSFAQKGDRHQDELAD